MRRKNHTQAQPSEQGFVLAATLWVLAALALIAGYFSIWTGSAIQDLNWAKDEFQNKIDVMSTRSTLLYLLGIQKLELGGFKSPYAQRELIYVDDQTYYGVGNALFSIQDESGLFFIRQWKHYNSFMPRFGVPGDGVQRLVDTLADYEDRDNDFRLAGAERARYRDAGRQGPPNRKLQTTWELRNVLGWDQHPGLWADYALPRQTTTFQFGGLINANAARKNLLMLFGKVDGDTADKLLEARRKKPFESFQDLSRLTENTFVGDMMSISFRPSPYQRLTIWTQDARRMRELHVELTPADLRVTKPWKIHYELSVPLTKEQRDAVVEKTSVPFFTSPEPAGK